MGALRLAKPVLTPPEGYRPNCITFGGQERFFLCIWVPLVEHWLGVLKGGIWGDGTAPESSNLPPKIYGCLSCHTLGYEASQMANQHVIFSYCLPRNGGQGTAGGTVCHPFPLKVLIMWGKGTTTLINIQWPASTIAYNDRCVRRSHYNVTVQRESLKVRLPELLCWPLCSVAQWSWACSFNKYILST